MRRWILIPMGSSTFSTTWKHRIANLEQQFLQLQGLAPPAPVDHEETDATFGIDED
jgi:hypothetical protein